MAKSMLPPTVTTTFQGSAKVFQQSMSNLTLLLVIAIAVAGLVFGQEAAQHQIVGAIQGIVGRQSAEAIQEMIKNAGARGAGITATLLGVGTLLIGAGGVVGQLQDSLNTIWGVAPKPGRVSSRWRWCSGSASCSWSPCW